jgi:probable O-glycosylation ligase (exosortase A-associated)
MYPQLMTWSFARTLPVAKLTALSTLGGILLNRSGNVSVLKEREMLCVYGLMVLFTLSSCTAIYPQLAWPQWQDMLKVVLMTSMTAALLSTKERLKLFLTVVAFSLGYYGFKGGIFSLLTGGQYMIWGPGDSIIGANNNLGLALNMCLPIFWYLAKNEDKRWLRWVFRAGFLLTIPSIMFTYSRGSFVGLAAVLLFLILKSRYRVLLLGILIGAAILIAGFLPEQWSTRQQTTLDYEQDGSAMSRIDNWKFCWNLALDRPLTGGGFQFFSLATLGRYAPEFISKYPGKAWDTHNIYLGILSAHGFPALLLFLAMIAFSFGSCRHMKRSVQDRHDLRWIANYSDLIQASLFGFLVNGMFVNMEYFELPYNLVALTVSMKVMLRHELDQREPLSLESATAPVLATNP